MSDNLRTTWSCCHLGLRATNILQLFAPSWHDTVSWILESVQEMACHLTGNKPLQRSDMTLVEVSQHAYGYLCIRTIVLFVFLRNSCKPDMVLVYIMLNNLCLSLSLSLNQWCQWYQKEGISDFNHGIQLNTTEFLQMSESYLDFIELKL